MPGGPGALEQGLWRRPLTRVSGGPEAPGGPWREAPGGPWRPLEAPGGPWRPACGGPQQSYETKLSWCPFFLWFHQWRACELLK